MFEDLKFYNACWYFNFNLDGYVGTGAGHESPIFIENDINSFGLLDAYGLTQEIYCSSVDLPPTSYKLMDQKHAETMINRGLYSVKLVQTGQSYNNLEDLKHDYLALKLSGVLDEQKET